MRVGVAQVLDHAVETLGVLAHPVDIFLTRAGIDHQQETIFAQPVHDHVIHKRSFGIEHRRIVRLADGQLRRIVHADVLHRGERPARLPAATDANVSHVADVENAHAPAYRPVFRNQSAA